MKDVSKPRVLIVDDEPDLCDIIRFNLTMEGYDVETVYSAEEALAKLDGLRQLNGSGGEDYQLLLLDVMMGGMSGFAMARKLKTDPLTRDLPIIFLTARDTENDVITGLNLGADDYISKPFRLRELLARIKAVLRRTGILESSAHHESALDSALPPGFIVDQTRKVVTVDGKDAQLTRTEFDLLCLLLSAPGRVFSRQEVIQQVWPPDVVVTHRTVDVCITRLRKKVGRHAPRIHTKSGFGYAFE